MIKMEKANVKEINKLLRDRSFLIALSNYSNNDLDTLYKNLGRVIEYFLSTPGYLPTKNYEELFARVNKASKKENFNIVIFNSETEKSIRVLGFNPESYYNDIELLTLDRCLSYISYHEQLTVYDSVEQALLEGSETPQVLYNSILKQPKGKEIPRRAGESEKDYYTRVMEKRLENSNSKNNKKIKKLAKKVLDRFLDKGIVLCFVPDKKIERRLKPNEMILITLPSKHVLINICAFNKDLKIGEELKVKASSPEVKPKQYSSLHYTRIEEVPIDDSFIYLNDELTGDVRYDIDTIYGKLDVKSSKEKLSSNPDVNIATIKKSSDINLTRRNGRYEIRLLYTK